MTQGLFPDAAAARAARGRRRGRRQLALPIWFEAGDNSYFCGLIARQLKMRALAHRAAGQEAIAAEADAIADLIAEGEFDWLR